MFICMYTYNNKTLSSSKKQVQATGLGSLKLIKDLV